MKLALTLEADSINVQALNMGRIVVDIDGVNLAELINNVAENGYSLRVAEESDQQSTCTPHRLQSLPAYAAVPHISRKQTTPGCTRCRIRPVTLVNRNGFISQVADICYVPMRGHTPVLRLKRLGLSKTFRRMVVTLTRRYGVSLIHLDASAECLPGLPTFNW
ncbi:aec77 [Escherichia coli]|nr:aec77 [Escherichia coli]